MACPAHRVRATLASQSKPRKSQHYSPADLVQRWLRAATCMLPGCSRLHLPHLLRCRSRCNYDLLRRQHHCFSHTANSGRPITPKARQAHAPPPSQCPPHGHPGLRLARCMGAHSRAAELSERLNPRHSTLQPQHTASTTPQSTLNRTDERHINARMHARMHARTHAAQPSPAQRSMAQRSAALTP